MTKTRMNVSKYWFFKDGNDVSFYRCLISFLINYPKLKQQNKLVFKNDAEGYDYEALLGAENLIRESKPKIAVTAYHKSQHAEEITAYLKSLVPEYNILTKGIYQEAGSHILLHTLV